MAEQRRHPFGSKRGILSFCHSEKATLTKAYFRIYYCTFVHVHVHVHVQLYIVHSHIHILQKTFFCFFGCEHLQKKYVVIKKIKI
jgi:hypothetical protein